MKWYDKYDQPIKADPLIVYTKNGKMMILICPNIKSWPWYVNKYNIVNWIYCDEIKPMNSI